MSVNDANISASNGSLDKLNADITAELIPTVVYVGTLMLMGIVGNLVVCVVFSSRMGVGAPQTLIATLAVFDLLTSLICMPMDVAGLRRFLVFQSEVRCVTWKFFTYFFTCASVLTVMVIAVDRYRNFCHSLTEQEPKTRFRMGVVIISLYRNVCHPLGEQMTKTHVRMAVAIIIFIALVVSAPALSLCGIKTSVIFGIMTYQCSTADSVKDTPYPLVHVGCILFFFLALLLTLCTMYFKIWREMRRHNRYMSKVSDMMVVESHSLLKSSSVGTRQSKRSVGQTVSVHLLSASAASSDTDARNFPEPSPLENLTGSAGSSTTSSKAGHDTDLLDRSCRRRSSNRRGLGLILSDSFTSSQADTKSHSSAELNTSASQPSTEVSELKLVFPEITDLLTDIASDQISENPQNSLAQEVEKKQSSPPSPEPQTRSNEILPDVGHMTGAEGVGTSVGNPEMKTAPVVRHDQPLLQPTERQNEVTRTESSAKFNAPRLDAQAELQTTNIAQQETRHAGETRTTDAASTPGIQGKTSTQNELQANNHSNAQGPIHFKAGVFMALKKHNRLPVTGPGTEGFTANKVAESTDSAVDEIFNTMTENTENDALDSSQSTVTEFKGSHTASALTSADTHREVLGRLQQEVDDKKNKPPAGFQEKSTQKPNSLEGAGTGSSKSVIEDCSSQSREQLRPCPWKLQNTESTSSDAKSKTSAGFQESSTQNANSMEGAGTGSSKSVIEDRSSQSREQLRPCPWKLQNTESTSSDAKSKTSAGFQESSTQKANSMEGAGTGSSKSVIEDRSSQSREQLRPCPWKLQNTESAPSDAKGKTSAGFQESSEEKTNSLEGAGTGSSKPAVEARTPRNAGQRWPGPWKLQNTENRLSVAEVDSTRAMTGTADPSVAADAHACLLQDVDPVIRTDEVSTTGGRSALAKTLIPGRPKRSVRISTEEVRPFIFSDEITITTTGARNTSIGSCGTFAKKVRIDDDSESRPSTGRPAFWEGHLTPRSKFRVVPSMSSYKTTATAVSITVTFLLSFLPHLSLLTARLVFVDFGAELRGAALAFHSILLRSYFINAVSNPVIYGVQNARFRWECLQLFQRMSPYYRRRKLGLQYFDDTKSTGLRSLGQRSIGRKSLGERSLGVGCTDV